ncbi:Uncharacterised protein [Klebsiella pneumoniae]|nr:hypothetical protein AZZ73_005202 [Klebsiella pneumoniae]SVX18098.1 Uncharacterised protein [Klebsiella pneumoniae]
MEAVLQKETRATYSLNSRINPFEIKVSNCIPTTTNDQSTNR